MTIPIHESLRPQEDVGNGGIKLEIAIEIG